MKSRTLCFAGLLLFTLGLSVNWPLAVVIGIPMWVYLLPAPIFGSARLFETLIKNLWMTLRSRKEPVPELVNDIAARFNTTPPRTMRILPSSKLNAAVNDSTLYITEGLKPWVNTQLGIGVIGHEMAHKSSNHSIKILYAWLGAILLAVLVSELITFGFARLSYDSHWLVTACIYLTVLVTVLPPASKILEYEADWRAADIVGAKTMMHTLKALGGWSSWEEDSETHPSISKRLSRLLGHPKVTS